MPLNEWLLKILACPKCKGDVVQKGKFLICEKCRLAFPILEDEVPDMLLEDAWDLKKAEENNFEHDLTL